MPKYLIVKPSSLGDIVHGLLVAHAIRRQQPDAQISWIAREIFAPLVALSTAVDEVFVFPRHGGLLDFFQMARATRRDRYDCVLDLQGLLRSALMAWVARSARRIGRRDYRELAGLFYHQKPELPPLGSHSHAVDILMKFLPRLGLQEKLYLPIDFRPTTEFNPAMEDYQHYKGAVVMFVGSRRAEKLWNGFTELTNFILLAEPKVKVVWASETFAEGRDSWRGRRFLNLTGRTTVSALPEVIRHAGMVIGLDSGPMHLAAAMGRPTVAIFGPTDADRFGPYPPRAPLNHVIKSPLAELRKLPAREVFDRVRSYPEWAQLPRE